MFQKHEAETAAIMGGRTVSGSGSNINSKSDVVTDTYRVECKSTAKDSISLKLLWLNKIAEEAIDSSRSPVLALRFENDNAFYKDWIMIPQDVFINLIQKDIDDSRKQ